VISTVGVSNAPGWPLVANMKASKWLLAARCVMPVPVVGKNCFIGVGNAWAQFVTLGPIYDSGVDFHAAIGLRLNNALGVQDTATTFVPDGNEHEIIMCNTTSAIDVYVDRVQVVHLTDMSHVSTLSGTFHMYQSSAGYNLPIRGMLAFGSVL
jgi:hypothetical protein